MKNTVILALLLFTSCVFAQQPAKNAPAAKAPAKASHKAQAAVAALLERAEQARKTGDLPTAIKLYKRAILVSPDMEDAHGGLSNAFYYLESIRLKAEAQAAGKDIEKGPGKAEFDIKVGAAQQQKLVEFYQSQKAAHPAVTAYRFELVKAQNALAQAEHREKQGWLRAELEKIVAADPKFAPALMQLGALLGTYGDQAKSRGLLRRACELKPENETYAFFYVYAFSDGDPKEFLRRVEDFASRFPKSQFSTGLLQAAAQKAETPQERIAILERAASAGEPQAYVVADLLALYARSDPAKAADLGEKKLKAAQASKTKNSAYQVQELTALVDYYGALSRAEKLLQAGQLTEAQALLEKVKPPEDHQPGPLFPKTRLTAELLLAQGKASEAYKYLLNDRQTMADAELTALAVKVGRGLGKTEAQVQEEIVSEVLARAKRPADFEVESLKGESKAKLSDFRGKYVLVNFWAPT